MELQIDFKGLQGEKITVEDVQCWLSQIYQLTEETDLDSALDLAYSYADPEQRKSVDTITALIHAEASGAIRPEIRLYTTYKVRAETGFIERRTKGGESREGPERRRLICGLEK